MQTDNTFSLHSSRNNLVEFLREHKLETAAVWVLDTLGPMNVVLAQFVHAGSALLRPTLTPGQVDSLTQILEDSTERQAFRELLQEDITHGK